jgi:chromate transporter
MAPSSPSFAELVRLFAKIGALSFGGPAGQIALMQRELVDNRCWIEPARFNHALNFCMLLPGPEAQQLATYCGWLLHGVRGGLATGLLFILPGAMVMLGLSLLYVTVGKSDLAQALLFGVKAVVLAIVLEALFRVAKRALKRRSDWLIAVAAFLALFLLHVPFPLVILVAGLIGYFRVGDVAVSAENQATFMAPHKPLRILFIGLTLWALPVLLMVLLFGPDAVFAKLSLFFSKMAVVTFGGAYAVLAYVAQEAVQAYRWLTPAEMIDGLGLAETTPGPLILVLQHVGFLAGWRNSAGLSPLAGGLLGAGVTTWVTFTPSFLWILLGAPYVEKLRQNVKLSGALAGITAAVVGVIFNMALWFGLHVMFTQMQQVSVRGDKLELPVLSSFSLPAVAIFAVAAWLLLVRHVSLWKVLVAGALLGLATAYLPVSILR